MRQIGFQATHSTMASSEEFQNVGVGMPGPIPLESEKIRIGSDGEGRTILSLRDAMGLPQAALWLGQAAARDSQLLKVLNSVVSNAINIAIHVPEDLAESEFCRALDPWGLALVEGPDGRVGLQPQDEVEIKFAVWRLGLASASDPSAIVQFRSLLESADKLAELIQQGG